jgi:hypothetical protein
MWVNLLPSRMKPRVIPFPAWYYPTITPALLIPSTDVLNAPGTVTVVNLKVNVGALAAVAVITNSKTVRTSTNVLQLFIVFPLGKFP